MQSIFHSLLNKIVPGHSHPKEEATPLSDDQVHKLKRLYHKPLLLDSQLHQHYMNPRFAELPITVIIKILTFVNFPLNRAIAMCEDWKVSNLAMKLLYGYFAKDPARITYYLYPHINANGSHITLADIKHEPEKWNLTEDTIDALAVSLSSYSHSMQADMFFLAPLPLQSLDLSNNTHVKEKFFIQCRFHLNHLESLNLNNVQSFSALSLSTLLHNGMKQAPKLKYIDLSFTSVNGFSVNRLCKCAPNLTTLKLNYLTTPMLNTRDLISSILTIERSIQISTAAVAVTADTISAVAAPSHETKLYCFKPRCNIQVLEVEGLNLTDDSATMLFCTSGLTHLSVADNPMITHKSLIGFIDSPCNVKSLNISYNSQMGNEAAKILCESEHLTKLVAKNTNINNSGCMCLIHVTKNLYYLNLSDNFISDAGVAAIMTNTRLKILILKHTLVGDPFLGRYLQSNRELEVVNVGRHQTSPHSVSDRGFSNLFYSNKIIKSFSASGHDITKKSLKYLTSKKLNEHIHLRVLKLNECGYEIGDSGAALIAQHATLEHIELQSSGIKNDGAAALFNKTFENLEYLDLGHNLITDDAIVNHLHLGKQDTKNVLRVLKLDFNAKISEITLKHLISLSQFEMVENNGNNNAGNMSARSRAQHQHHTIVNLQQVNLQMNSVSDSIMDFLKFEMHTLRSLHFLDISLNTMSEMGRVESARVLIGRIEQVIV